MTSSVGHAQVSSALSLSCPVCIGVFFLPTPCMRPANGREPLKKRPALGTGASTVCFLVTFNIPLIPVLSDKETDPSIQPLCARVEEREHVPIIVNAVTNIIRAITKRFLCSTSFESSSNNVAYGIKNVLRNASISK